MLERPLRRVEVMSASTRSGGRCAMDCSPPRRGPIDKLTCQRGGDVDPESDNGRVEQVGHDGMRKH